MYLTLRFIQLQLFKNIFFYANIEVSSSYIFLLTRDAMIKKENKTHQNILRLLKKTVSTDITVSSLQTAWRSPFEAPDTPTKEEN